MDIRAHHLSAPRGLPTDQGRCDGPASRSSSGGRASSAVANATDQPAFCGSACHEMGPFTRPGRAGAHKDISCVDCHVDPQPVARDQAQVRRAAGGRRPHQGRAELPAGPAARTCRTRVACDATPTSRSRQVGFSHAEHAKRGPCVKCHADVGHDVTTTALQQAGIFNVAYKHAIEPTQTATPGGGKADVVGHVTVDCSKCHDMAAMRCSRVPHTRPRTIRTARPTARCATRRARSSSSRTRSAPTARHAIRRPPTRHRRTRGLATVPDAT